MGVLQLVVGLQGKPHQCLPLFLHLAQGGQYIGVLHQGEGHSFVTLFLQLVVGGLLGAVVGHGGRKDSPLAGGEGGGGRLIHLAGRLHIGAVDEGVL